MTNKTILRLYTGAPPAHETCPETGKLLCEIEIYELTSWREKVYKELPYISVLIFGCLVLLISLTAPTTKEESKYLLLGIALFVLPIWLPWKVVKFLLWHEKFSRKTTAFDRYSYNAELERRNNYCKHSRHIKKTV